jgi:hypothetical protein
MFCGYSEISAKLEKYLMLVAGDCIYNGGGRWDEDDCIVPG